MPNPLRTFDYNEVPTTTPDSAPPSAIIEAQISDVLSRL